MKYFPLTEMKYAPKTSSSDYWDFINRYCFDDVKTVTWDSETSFAATLQAENRLYRHFTDINMHQVNGVWVKK